MPAAGTGSGWKTGADVEESVAGRIGGWLDRVPGYRGYRAKEDRRDADRRVRDDIARTLTAQANRVQGVARDLANARRLNDIGPVDALDRALRRLVDRVTTASYGYGGLFSDRDIDERALDQLKRFDESLLAGAAALESSVAPIEHAASGTDELAAAAKTAQDQVQSLHAQLDLRSDVIETGEPADEQRLVQVLQPVEATSVPPAFEIGFRDAISVLGDNFVVDARIDVRGSDAAFRLFRLEQGEPERWLFVATGPTTDAAMLEAVDSPGDQALDSAPTIRGAAFTPFVTGQGEGEISGVQAASGRRPVRYSILSGEEPSTLAVSLDWGSDRQVFVGERADVRDIEMFGSTQS